MVADLGKLKSVAERTVSEKERCMDAKVKTQEDMRGITEISHEIVPLTKDDTLLQRVKQGCREVCYQASKISTDIQKIDIEQLIIKDDLIAIRESAVATREKARRTEFKRTDRAHIDEMGRDQTRTMGKVDNILSLISNADEKFEAMLGMTVHYYNIAERVSRSDFRGNDVKNFTGHTLQHALEVRTKMQDLKNVMGCVGFDESSLFSQETMDAAVAFHDTGMDGNLSYFNTLFLRAFPELVDKPREKHSLESGIRILSHRDQLAPIGVDVDQSALMITLHSKTGFLEGGKRDLSKADFGDIKTSAENFARECASKKIDWDMTWLCKDGIWNDEALQKTANSASLLRLSDANRDGGKQYAQNGAGYSFANEKICEGRAAILDKNAMHREIEGMSIAYDYGDKKIEEIDDDSSRAIVYGEHNIKSMNLLPTEDGGLVYRFEVHNPKVGIGCTVHAIQERLDEVKYSVFSKLRGKIEVMSDNEHISEILQYLSLPDGWSVA